MVLFLDGSGVEGQPPKAGAAAVRVRGVGQVTESVVEKVVYGAASHGEVQAVADVVGEIGEEVREVWMVVDAEADMASLRRLASRPLHEALGTGLASQVYAIWHGLEMTKVPLIIHLVKQESHRAGVGNHEADGAAQAVEKEQEPEWRVPERKEHLHLVHIPPRVGEEEKARWVLEGDRGKQELRVYPQPVHMLAQVRGGPEVVELNEYLEGKVGQRAHYPSVLRPEMMPKRLQTRKLQAITGQVPVRETIMRWYRHKGMDLPEEYMRCHCGQGQETYEHFMRCEQYKGIEEPLVRDQDIPSRKAPSGTWPLSDGSPTVMAMGMRMLPHRHNGPPKWRFGATMSCPMVTWCVAGSPATTTGIKTSRLRGDGAWRWHLRTACLDQLC